ncbi:MAG: 16S rRNA (cytosine(1402)-N(4))-methyltransferase RsmH, partial [Bacilli bacterium]|nr:16S rRNA (cytosine(1402)-N(4))-methyltransferase RsmH [Bacilli bacterium]
GGHSSSILDRIKKGYLFAFDQDSEAIRHSTDRLSKIGTNFTIIKSNFVNMKEELKKLGIEKVDGILFDLGVSSPQLDEKERGFSFHEDAPLDMRMDREQKLTAYDVVNNYSKEELARIFLKYGEDKFSNNIAKKIVEYRTTKKIETTLELVEIIKTAVPMKFRIDKHPARQIFQAIRIEVNHELDVLEPALNQALDLLNVGGRVSVITFHSLEDRIVKNIFREKCSIDEKLKGLPNIPEEYLPDFKLVENKAIVPSEEELERNPRARSSKLRVIERVK